MTDDLMKTNGGVPSTEFGDALMRGVEDVRAGMSTNDMGKPLLRLIGDGEWVFGQTNEEVQEGSHWAVNLMSLMRGWCCWKDGQLLGQVMDSVQVPRPACPAPINGQGFSEQYSMELTCINGDDAGTLVLYKNNSLGFKNAFADLMGKIRARYAMDKAHYWPVITLGSDSYEHKKYNKTIYNPILTIASWADAEGNLAGAPTPALTKPVQAAPEPAPPKPARQRKAPLADAQVTVEQPEPLTTTQVHTGQRRRPAAR